MAETVKVRVVRCPKCDNLLPELADYSVYQCGACGTLLRAKEENPKLDTSSGKSEEERAEQVSRRLENLPEKGRINVREGFDDSVDREKNKLSDVDGVRFSASNYPEEGPSNYHSDSSYGYREQLKRTDRAQNPEKDQIELMRKLDELKDQLSRFTLGSNRASTQFHGSHFVGKHGFPPPMPNSNDISFGSQIPRRAPQNILGIHQQQPYFSGHSVDTNHYPFDPYTQNKVFHPPSCSCFHCYQNYLHVSPPVASNAFYDKKFHDVPNNTVLYHQENLGQFHKSRTLIPPTLISPHTRWPSDVNSEIDNFARHRPQRMVLASVGRRCHPIAGGAPFLTCFNCFKLLKLPRKILLRVKNQQKMQCGACSTVISFSLVNKKLVLHFVHAQRKQIPVQQVDDNSDGLWKHTSHSSDRVNFSYDDYENSGYEFKSVDIEPVVSLTYMDSNSSKPEDRQNIDSEDANTEITPKRNVSVKEASFATDMGGVVNDYSNTGVSQNSGDSNRKNAWSQISKGSESFFSNIIKKSFRNFSRSKQKVEHGRGSNVWVNGHLISIHLVKKAEKLAGPVQQGQYWYDVRAGFWGIMDGPCLGIIPPFIEEFNHPMTIKCAGGNTGAFVNGRELHQKDMELLCSRGLPTVRDRSYIVEISGRVVDDNTGEELQGLGKLAPTVEKAKHGFGMRSPRAAA